METRELGSKAQVMPQRQVMPAGFSESDEHRRHRRMGVPERPVMSARFSGAVLCGGRSRRFGRDKATYVFNGTPLAKISLLALREAGASEVFSIGGDADALGDMGFSAVPDDYPGEGPLGGIICALRQAALWQAASADEPSVEDIDVKARDSRTQDDSSEDICVVLACDLPWASASAVSEVVKELASDSNLNAVLPIGEDDIPQYLHGAWRLRCLPSLEAAFARGGRSVNDGLEMLHEGSVRLCQVSDIKSLKDMDEMP